MKKRFDRGENSVYSGSAMEISIAGLTLRKTKGAMALRGAFFIARPVKIDGSSRKLKSLPETFGSGCQPTWPVLCFDTHKMDLIPNQRRSVMNNIVNFPTKHLPIYQQSPDEMIILKITMDQLEKRHQDNQSCQPYTMYDYVKQAFQEIKEENLCEK